MPDNGSAESAAPPQRPLRGAEAPLFHVTVGVAARLKVVPFPILSFIVHRRAGEDRLQNQD